MPTYLTPGVYVEEVSSGNKPIEGVATSVAAFIGLLPGGPVNKPMRISNWTQFANLYSDPENPQNGPFMEGSFTAHAVYGYFMNGGALAWIIRVGDEQEAPSARAALPAAADSGVEAFRAVALPAVKDSVKIEISEEPQPEGKEPGEPTYKVVVTAGDQREEYPGVSLKKGRAYLATKVNSASKLIRIEETGATLPDGRVAAGTYSLSAPSASSAEVTAGDFEGDVATRKGMGGASALDEVTMLVMPDIVNLNGDGAQMRDLQGKMIAHAELMGDRMTILDTPDGMLPQEVLEWRMNTAGYDSKMAAMYWPWIEVMDPLTKRPMRMPPSGHIAGVWARVDDTRGVHKAPANEVIRGANGLAFQITHAEQGELNRNGINCIRAFPGRGNPDLGCADAVQRSRVALHQCPPAVQLRRRVDHARHAVERVRAQRPAAVGEPDDERVDVPDARLSQRRAVRGLGGRGVLRQVRRRDEPARACRGRPGRLRDRDRAGQAGRVRDLPPQPVHGRRRGRGRRVTPNQIARARRTAWAQPPQQLSR